MANLVTKVEFQKVKDSLAEYARVNELIELRKQVIPKVDGFKNNIRDFEKSNEDQRMCIRAFDEALCRKVNLLKLQSVEAYNEEVFMKK